MPSITIARSFTSPLDAEVSWAVSRHAPRGFKFDHAQFHESDSHFVNNVLWDISGRVCGDDPYAVDWSISEDATNTVEGHEFPANTVFQQRIGRGGGRQDVGSGGDIRFELLPGPPAQMKITLGVWTGWQATAATTVLVPVTEDLSCPEPKL